MQDAVNEGSRSFCSSTPNAEPRTQMNSRQYPNTAMPEHSEHHGKDYPRAREHTNTAEHRPCEHNSAREHANTIEHAISERTNTIEHAKTAAERSRTQPSNTRTQQTLRLQSFGSSKFTNAKRCEDTFTGCPLERAVSEHEYEDANTANTRSGAGKGASMRSQCHRSWDKARQTFGKPDVGNELRCRGMPSESRSLGHATSGISRTSSVGVNVRRGVEQQIVIPW